MSKETYLEVFNFSIRKRNADKSDCLELADLPGAGDFIKFFREYLSYIETDLELNSADFTALKLKDDTLKGGSTSRILRGVFESGAYGSEKDSIDTITGKRGKLGKNIAIVQPFYFLIALPDGSKRGFFMLQRSGNEGISTIVKISMQNFFRKKYSDFMLDFNPYLSKEIIKEFTEKGKISEIIFTQKHLPSDKADKLGLKGIKESIQSVEFRIKAKRSFFFKEAFKNIYAYSINRDKSFLNKSIANNIGLDGKEEIKIKSHYNGATRIIDLTDNLKLKPYYKVEDVKNDATGHPSFKSVDSYATNLYEEVIQ